MTIHTDAIYEGGLLRPLVPLALKEQEVVSLTISNAADESTPQRSELDEFRRVMASLPLQSAEDGFCGADHDQILYDQP
jgi:predicted DNA-binding antitoxin AbrB/MazE fold protein